MEVTTRPAAPHHESAEFLTVREVQQRLRLSESTTYRLMALGRIPSVKIGGSIRVPRADLDELLTREKRG